MRCFTAIHLVYVIGRTIIHQVILQQHPVHCCPFAVTGQDRILSRAGIINVLKPISHLSRSETVLLHKVGDVLLVTSSLSYTLEMFV